jgi:hypothetical protein
MYILSIYRVVWYEDSDSDFVLLEWLNQQKYTWATERSLMHDGNVDVRVFLCSAYRFILH